MGELICTKFGSLGQLFDGPHATPKRRREGPYFLNISSLNSGRLDLSASDHVSEDDFVQWTRRVTPQTGDLLFSYETRLGEAALMPDGVQACLGRRMALLRPDRSKVDPRFLLYFYLSPGFQSLIAKRTIHGATVERIGLATMPDWDVAIPKLSRQKAIGELLGALDDKIAVNERAAKIAFDLAQSLVRSVLSSQDGLVQRKFGALGQLFDGPHATPTRRMGGPYFLNISSLKCGRLDLAESDHVSEEDFAKWTRRVTPEAGDLLFSYETRIGEAALMRDGIRACLGRRMALLRPNRGVVDPVFLLHFYLSAEFQRVIAAHTIHGATVPRIGLATMPEWDIAIPGFEAQRPTAAALGSLHSAMVQAERESRDLARTRDELLPLLMSGKLRVKDAETVGSGDL